MCKIKYLFICFLLFCSKLLFSQQDTIRVSGELMNNNKFTNVVVMKFGVGLFPIYNATIKNNKFEIKVAKNQLEAGVYRFQYSQTEQNRYIDVVMDGSEAEINFKINISNQESYPTFLISDTNKKWYEYLKNRELLSKKIGVLHSFIESYPENNAQIVKGVDLELTNQIKKLSGYHSNFIKVNKDLLALIVKNNPIYFTNPRDHYKVQILNKRNVFWNNIDTNNPKLINTPLYTEYIINYLQYYLNPEMKFSEKEQEEGFKKSVDTIMLKFGKNIETKKFALKYLSLGFKEIGNEKVLQYIDENYKELAQQCHEEADKFAFEQRLKGYESIKVGMISPAIEYTDTEGNKKSLYDISSDFTVVLFWASWCDHCMIEVPKLNEWKKMHPEIKILAISLDVNNDDYNNAKSKLGNMIHFCDFKKWNSKPALDYFIVGTPTLILLDKEKKIIQKFSSFEALQEHFRI